MVDRLVGVYNARGGLLGEISYVTGKLAGATHCALCDITHGLNPLGRKEWKQALHCLPIPIELVHLNEMDSRTAKVVAQTTPPAVLLLTPQQDRVLIDKADLEACGKEPQALVELILERLG